MIEHHLIFRSFLLLECPMVLNAFLREKKELLEEIKRRGSLIPEFEREIEKIYGGRGKRAMQLIRRGAVIRRGRRWFVRGKKGEYEVVKKFCACRDYVMNIATGKAGIDMCYHALAKNICEALDAFYRVEPKEDRRE